MATQNFEDYGDFEDDIPPPVDGDDDDDDGDGDDDGKDGNARKKGKGEYGVSKARQGKALKDLYETPESCTEAMMYCLGFVGLFGEGAKILEPCYGKGAIARVLEEKGFKVIKLDKFTLPEKTDALCDPVMKTHVEECDAIVTNPPFSKKLQFLAWLYSTGKPFVVLMPFQLVTTAGAQGLLMANGATILCPTPAPKFKKEDGTEVMVGSVVWLVGNIKTAEDYVGYSGKMQFVLMPTEPFEKDFAPVEGQVVRRVMCRFNSLLSGASGGAGTSGGAGAGAVFSAEFVAGPKITLKRKKPTN